MFNLDTSTIAYINILFSFMFFIGILLCGFKNNRFNDLRFYSFGNLSFFIAFSLIAFNQIIPGSFVLLFSHSFFALALFLYYFATISFLRNQFRFLLIHFIALILLFASQVYFTFFNLNEQIRDILYYTFISIEAFIIFFLFFKSSIRNFRIQKIFASFPFVLFFIINILMLIWLIDKSSFNQVVDASLLLSLEYLVYLILVVQMGFSLIWIAMSMVNNDLVEQARKDPLTEVFNHRAFMDELKREIARSKRQSLTFSLVLAEIDNYKVINEEFGYVAGNSVLIAFTQLVTKNLRFSDILARYRGEEFIMILPNTSKKYAGETAERIRKIVEISKHPFNGKDISYSVSQGVTSYDLDAQNIEELLEKVDMALSQAKFNGMNRVEIK